MGARQHSPGRAMGRGQRLEEHRQVGQVLQVCGWDGGGGGFGPACCALAACCALRAAVGSWG